MPDGGFAGAADGPSEELRAARLAEAEQPPDASPLAARMLASEEVREETGPAAAIRLGYRGLAREVALGVVDTVSAYFPLAEATAALDEMVVTEGLGQVRQRAASSLRADVVTPGDSAGVPSEQAAGDSVNWMLTSLQHAEREAGFGVLTVPDLPILEVELGTVEGAAAVRVRQSVSQGVVLTLTQRPETGALADRGFSDAGPSPDAVEAETTVRDGVRVHGAAPPMPSDSLRLLLDRAR
jgi:hypothetical protein